ncbi:uncharacterized protein LOC62_04G005257 [Vanrija pseudolonga]|uniref:F-box domain-containing protein n=1 Tax=Vanrija pseudolonga TaxID=143232 RepID=A0AAF0YC51_9TREE|nr:hypothetical protein LOC62_04G005257 [Vanrija pseudolonga]
MRQRPIRGPAPLTGLQDTLHAALVHRLAIDEDAANAALVRVRCISRAQWEAELGADQLDVEVLHPTFPTIIDSILAHADVRGLMAIRATSRAFKRRVDAQLFDHAVLLTPLKVATLTTPTGSPLPFAPSGVRVLDVASCHLGPTSTSYRRAFTSLQVLRRTNSTATDRRGAASFCPITVVDGYDVPSDSQSRRPYIFIPPSTKRYTLHIAWLGPRPDGTPEFMGSESLREVVLVIAGGDNLVYSTPPPTHLVTELVCRFLLVLRSGGSITLVGMRSPETVTATVRTRLMRSSTAQPKAVDAAMGRLRCLSRDEWLAELGDRREVEGEWEA